MKLSKELVALAVFLSVNITLLIGGILIGLPVLSYGYDGFVVKALMLIIGLLFEILVLMLWPKELEEELDEEAE